jgi:hypothetical protein
LINFGITDPKIIFFTHCFPSFFSLSLPFESNTFLNLTPVGDDGANSRTVRVNRGGTCGYVASFPASSPYVTAVGATQVDGEFVNRLDMKFDVINVVIFSNANEI